MRSNIVKLMGIMLMVTFILSVIPMQTQAQMDEGMYGGEFKIAVNEEIDINPLTATNDTSWNVINLLYDSLAKIDPQTLQPIPWIATEWVVDTTDNKTITVNLRNDVTWHAGSALTATDVKYTYDTYDLDYVSSVTVLSSTSVKFILTEPTAGFFSDALTKPLIPNGFTATSDENGCGPFALYTHIGGDYTIAAYEDYFNGRPYLDSIKYILYPGIDEAAIALIDKTIDFIGWSVKSTDTTDIRYIGHNTSLMNESHVTVIKNPGLSFYYMGYNTAKAPLNDVNLRKAISYCLDRDAICAQEGGTIITDSIISPKNPFWCNYSIPKFRMGKVGAGIADLTPANMFLDEMGYLDVDGDGWRDTPSGEPFTLTLSTPSSAGPDADAQKAAVGAAIWGLMRGVGINTIHDLNTTENRKLIIEDDSFDLYLEVGKAKLDPSFMYDLAHTNGAKNYANYDDTTFNNLITKANEEMNITLRQQYIKDCQGYLAEKLPYAPLLYYKTIEVADRTKYTGWVNMMGGVNNFWSFTSLHYIMEGELSVKVDAFETSLNTGGETTVTATVTDAFGEPIQGVSVSFQGDGTITPNEGLTDTYGKFTAAYTAPSVETVTTVTITADAVFDAYYSAQGTTQLTIHPIAHSLSVSISATPAVINSGESATISVVVRDELYELVDDATVTLSITPLIPGNELELITGKTSSTGSFTTTFNGDASVETLFTITAKASKVGYADGSGSKTVAVHASGGALPSQGLLGLPAPNLIYILGAILIVVLVFSVKRGKDKKRKEEEA